MGLSEKGYFFSFPNNGRGARDRMNYDITGTRVFVSGRRYFGRAGFSKVE